MVTLRRLGAFLMLVGATALLIAAIRYTYQPGSPGPPFVCDLWLAAVALPALLGLLMARLWRLRWPWLYGLLAYCLASGLAAGATGGAGEPPAHFVEVFFFRTLCPEVVADVGDHVLAIFLNTLSFLLVGLLSWGLNKDSEQRRAFSRRVDAGPQRLS